MSTFPEQRTALAPRPVSPYAARTAARVRHRRRLALTLLGVITLILAVAGLFAFGLAALTGPVPGGSGKSGPAAAVPEPTGELGRQDGAFGDDGKISPFEDDHPAIAELDPELRSAMQRAATDAQAQGVDFWVTSGWRSERLQQRLFDDAVTNYGSVEEATRWVSTPDSSNHVTGTAVDIGPTDANSWLSQHGAGYGLCQTYANEMWHFELAEITPDGWCPEMIADASAG